MTAAWGTAEITTSRDPGSRCPCCARGATGNVRALCDGCWAYAKDFRTCPHELRDEREVA